MNPDNNNENPLVTVIVPVYNTERYLTQCVNSILCQTLKNIEVILIDDGSTDNCPAMCDAYARQDKRVKAVHKPNGGYGKACNTGISMVRSKYFGIIESDDYIELDMFEKLYGMAQSNGLDIARCHYYFYNSQTNTHEHAEQYNVPINIVCRPRDIPQVFIQAPSLWAILYRTDFILENNIYFLETPGASYQDTSFIFKVYACAQRFMLTDKTCVHYRIGNENASVASKEKVYCVCDEYREIERFLHEKGLYDEMLSIFPKVQFLTYMWNYRRIAVKHRWPFLQLFAREMRGYISGKIITRGVYSAEEMAKIYIIAFLFPVFHFIPVYLILSKIHNN